VLHHSGIGPAVVGSEHLAKWIDDDQSEQQNASDKKDRCRSAKQGASLRGRVKHFFHIGMDRKGLCFTGAFKRKSPDSHESGFRGTGMGASPWNQKLAVKRSM
jgi:hypothetical protein